MKIASTILLTLFTFCASAQSMIEKMYKQKRYKEITEMASKTNELGGKNIFVIGQSFLKLNQNAEALEMFNQAINKGYKNEEVYFARGIAQDNLEMRKQAQQSFRQALYYKPNRKKILIELAASYYKDRLLDSALSTYTRIEKHWGDYLPAVLMVCQIQHEKEKYSAALECYYSKLYLLKKDDYYYREALMSVIRIEWHHFKNYPKAEVALKNLLADFPNDRENNMLMMQFYNNTEQYAEAELQEKLILDAYKNMTLPNDYYTKGAMLIEQFTAEQYLIEVYRNFQPEKKNGVVYRAYIFNFNGSRALGKIEGTDADSTAWIEGYAIDLPIETPKPLRYETFKTDFLRGLFQPETPLTDTIKNE